MILDCNGELFFATHSIETYLGFHQVRRDDYWKLVNVYFIIHLVNSYKLSELEKKDMEYQ